MLRSSSYWLNYHAQIISVYIFGMTLCFIVPTSFDFIFISLFFFLNLETINLLIHNYFEFSFKFSFFFYLFKGPHSHAKTIRSNPEKNGFILPTEYRHHNYVKMQR